MTALRASIAPRRTVWSERALALREWIGQVLRPSGLFVACLGPDGSGKSSVIAALEAHPLEPFAGVDTMRLRPGVLRRKNLEPMEHTTPKKPRGFFGTTAKLTMFAVDYWLGYWLSIRPQLTRSRLVVSDRYYDDVLVDPLRYRILGARLFARVLLPWIPRPHLWFVFDAPADVLASRQSDVPEAESSRLRGEYRRVLRARESLVLLDARQPVEEVVAQAERAIISHLARRTARRWGLPVPTTRNPRSSELLLFFCRRQVPVLSRLVRVAFNSDIYCRLPDDIHLPHPYGIVMHPQAAIGHRVTVMQQVTIGSKDPSDNVAPVIGDDVYIGAGARVLGDVRIGNGAVVGANAVVTRDIPAGVTVVGANRILSAQIQKAPGVSDTSVTHFPSQIHRGS